MSARVPPAAQTAGGDPLEGSGLHSPERGVFCNRTLNLRSIRAIGYDMDYTLIHYHEEKWEREAYEHTRESFRQRGWPVEELEFNPGGVTRGLTIDLKLGNLVKPNRFGYVIKASHGTRPLDFDTQRKTYARTPVSLGRDRFVFMNTMFSYSEASLFAQLVDLLDEGKIPGRLGYATLHEEVRTALDRTHMEGTVKARIIADPAAFVDHDPDTPLALLDQRRAGKKLLLITNSEWYFTQSMMRFAFDRFLPDDMTWRDLFDIVIVSARKPSFFSERHPLYEIVDEDDGLLRPSVAGLQKGGVFFGGNAALVEEHLGLNGDEILYVGDHLFGDVHVSKDVRQWRTALILRELEEEVRAERGFAEAQRKLTGLMVEKESLERELSARRLESQRLHRSYGPRPEESRENVEARVGELRSRLSTLDETIAPLARAAGELGNVTWGPLMRAGVDKSLFTRQVERYADVYTSRVSNFLRVTPFGFLRAPRGNLPHDFA